MQGYGIIYNKNYFSVLSTMSSEPSATMATESPVFKNLFDTSALKKFNVREKKTKVILLLLQVSIL